MKKVEKIFSNQFSALLRHNPNAGIMAANYFWPKVAKCIELGKIARELTENKVLKNHFSTGHTPANILKVAYSHATKIEVVHHMDNRSLPTVTVLFFLSPELIFYELDFSFDAATGAPLLVSSSEKTEILHAVAA